jgi:hypothetical protein
MDDIALSGDGRTREAMAEIIEAVMGLAEGSQEEDPGDPDGCLLRASRRGPEYDPDWPKRIAGAGESVQ